MLWLLIGPVALAPNVLPAAVESGEHWCHTMKLGGSGVEGYDDRVAQEVELYADMDEVHALPAIYAYGASRYSLPLLHELGYESMRRLLAVRLGSAVVTCRAAGGLASRDR